MTGRGTGAGGGGNGVGTGGSNCAARSGGTSQPDFVSLPAGAGGAGLDSAAVFAGALVDRSLSLRARADFAWWRFRRDERLS